MLIVVLNLAPKVSLNLLWLLLLLLLADKVDHFGVHRHAIFVCCENRQDIIVPSSPVRYGSRLSMLAWTDYVRGKASNRAAYPSPLKAWFGGKWCTKPCLPLCTEHTLEDQDHSLPSTDEQKDHPS